LVAVEGISIRPNHAVHSGLLGDAIPGRKKRSDDISDFCVHGNEGRLEFGREELLRLQHGERLGEILARVVPEGQAIVFAFRVRAARSVAPRNRETQTKYAKRKQNILKELTRP